MNNKEYFSMLSISMLTIEFIFLPWIIATISDTHGIISLILLTIIKIIIWIIVSRILMNYSGHSILEIIELKYGKYVGYIVKTIYVLYLMYVQVFIISTAYSLVSSYSLESTPKSLIVGIILIAVFYSIQDKQHAIFKLSKLGVYLCIGLVLVISLLISKIDYTNFFPIQKNFFPNIMYTTFIITSFFSGLECSLIYTKYVEDTKSIRKIGIMSILFNQLILILFTVVCYGVLGKEIIIKQKWSLFAMLSLLDTEIISKPEIVMCFISVFIILITISIYTYCISECINTTSKKHNHKTLINIFIVALSYISTIYISNKYNMYELLQYKQVYPIIVLIILLMCLKKEKRKDRGAN